MSYTKALILINFSNKPFKVRLILINLKNIKTESKFYKSNCSRIFYKISLLTKHAFIDGKRNGDLEEKGHQLFAKEYFHIRGGRCKSQHRHPILKPE